MVLLQDAAYIEKQRQLIYDPQAARAASNTDDSLDASTDEASTDEAFGDSSAAASSPNLGGMSIHADDYRKLKQWKDTVGAQTFQQLHQRIDRCALEPAVPKLDAC